MKKKPIRNEEEIKNFLDGKISVGSDKINALCIGLGVDADVRFGYPFENESKYVSYDDVLYFVFGKESKKEGTYIFHNKNLSEVEEMAANIVCKSARGTFIQDFADLPENIRVASYVSDGGRTINVLITKEGNMGIIPVINGAILAPLKMYENIDLTPKEYELIKLDDLEDALPGTIVYLGEELSEIKEINAYGVIGGDGMVYSFCEEEFSCDSPITYSCLNAWMVCEKE